MSLAIRYMSRSNWLRVPDRDYTYINVDNQGFKGVAGLIKLTRVNEPRTVMYGDIPVKIIDYNYYWLQFGPEDQDYWLTVMYNEKEELVQYYFDVTDSNTILDNGESRFTDLMLDVVVLPDGKIILLDEDDLEEALQGGEITQEQFDKAYGVARQLMEELDGKEAKLREFCNTYFQILKKRMGDWRVQERTQGILGTEGR